LAAAAASANAAAVAVAITPPAAGATPRLGPPNPLGNSALACMSLFNVLSSVPMSTKNSPESDLSQAYIDLNRGILIPVQPNRTPAGSKKRPFRRIILLM
jgi:hypothetical protein